MSLWASGLWSSGLWAANFWAESGGSVPPDIVTTSLPNGAEGVAYSQQIAATGSGPITWALDAPAPAGWSIGAATGLLANTSPTPGLVTARIRATNAVDTDLQVITFQIAEVDEFLEAPPSTRVWRVTGTRTPRNEPEIRRGMDGVAWVEMQAGEFRDWGLDYADELEAGETLLSSTWVAVSGLTLGEEGTQGSIATTWVTAGATAGAYALRNTVTTSGQRVLKRTLMVQVVDSLS